MKEDEIVKIFQALANNRRLKIIKLLTKNSQMTVGEIASRINLSFKSTSRHLILLYRAGLLNYQKIGLNVLYGLNKNPLNRKILNLMI